MNAPTPCRLVLTKWGDRPHWEYDALRLGSDEHGDWIGIPAGTFMSRPDATFVPPVDSVVLAPRQESWLATFYAPGFRVLVYVDVTTPPYWEGDTLRAVDLDLDVVRGETGRVWIDDEDEFADHRIRFGYPDDVVAAASQTCTRVHGQLSAGVGPFDGPTADRWLAALSAVPDADEFEGG